MKKIISTLLLATSVSQIALSQVSSSIQVELTDSTEGQVTRVGVEIKVDPRRSALIESIRQLELPEQYATPQQREDRIKAVLDQLRIQDLLGQEGDRKSVV